MSALSEVRQREMEILLALRASNESKLSPAENSCALSVCVCQKAPSGAMVQCELCRDIFHSDCVSSAADLEYGQAWLCPLCQRSRKPPLDKVLPLLASLQRIRVRLPEGDALRFLIERTVRWQHRVQQACADGTLERVSAAGRVWPRMSSYLTQEINGWSFYMEHQSVPLQGLGPELEKLMVEGFLLQVTLPETEQLYRYLLYKLVPRPSRGSPYRNDTDSSSRGSPHHKNGVSSVKKEANRHNKRTKRRKESSDSQHSEKAKKSRKKKPKKSKERSDESKRTCSPSHTVSDPALSDSEEDFSLCAAPWCREPEGDEVNWVQCDGSCNQWFHQVCVGLSAERAEKEDYVCISCTQPDYDRGE